MEDVHANLDQHLDQKRKAVDHCDIVNIAGANHLIDIARCSA